MPRHQHADLRAAILDAAADTIARDGVDGLSLRAIAAGLSVSHTAFRRHFGDREGVLNALAVRGNRLLAEHLRAAAVSGDFVEVGVAYVRFALANPGPFAVMFRPDLLDNDDPELTAARAEAYAPLREGVAAKHLPDPEAGEVAGWGAVHGIATLALSGNLHAADGVEALARRALALMYPSSVRQSGFSAPSDRPGAGN